MHVILYLGGAVADITGVSDNVLSYFKKVSGAYGPLGFQIVRAQPSQHGWTVECEFFPYVGAPITRYRVDLDDTGDILQVERVETGERAEQR